MNEVIVTGTLPSQGLVQARPNFAATTINNSSLEQLIRQRDFVPRGGNVGGSDDLTRLLQKEFTPRGGNLPEVKVTATKAKKFLRGGVRALSRIAAPISLVTMANDIAMGILNWNKRNFAGGAKPPPQTPKKSASTLSSGVNSNASSIDEVFVVASRPGQFSNRNREIVTSKAPVRSSGRIATRSTPSARPSVGRQPDRRSAGAGWPDSDYSLTSLQEPGLASTPKTKTQPKPKLPLNDQCVRERQPRPKCPARGYKLICKEWSKKSCL